MMTILDLPHQKYNLDNRLEVILFQNKSLPFTAINIWYRVGSANEIKGKSGLAHLFEHMMFQGSKNVQKEMHFKYIQEAGGILNASTSFDRTNYFEKLPANELEMGMWLESDRMGYFLDALSQTKLDNQRSVVLNERLERYDNQPYGLAWEKLLSEIYPENHPYHWPTIGYYNDIENYTLDDVQNFFKTFYSPSNASLVLAGNFEMDEARNLVEKYFGSLSNASDIKIPTTDSKVQVKSKLISYEDKVNLERIYIAWPTVKAFSADDSSLEILSDILSGSKNSRLTRKLVYDLQLVQDVNTIQFSGKYGGHFMIVATAKPGKSLDNIKQIIFDELSLLIRDGILNSELARSKNSIRSNFIYSLQNIDTIADMLNLYNFYLGEPNSFNFDLNRYDVVDESNLQKVADEYLMTDCVELRVTPENNNAG